MPNAKNAKPASLADIVASATRAQRTVAICVAGDLNAQYGQLEEQLRRLNEARSDSLDDDTGGERRAVAEQLQRLREQMFEHEHTFTFQALGAKAWSDLKAEHPARDGRAELYNVDTFFPACVAASLVEINGQPVTVTVEDLAALWDEALNEGQRDQLFTAAWEANTGRMSVPFSRLASATLQTTDEK